MDADGWMLALAVALNINNLRMLALTIAVGVSVFISVPRDSYEAFYFFCMVSETIIAVSALLLRASASTAIFYLCVLLVVLHYFGFKLDGSTPLSPYHVLVQFCQHAEIAACILLSNPLLRKTRKS